MFEVSRRTGRITIHHSAAHNTQVTTAETISEIARKVREIRHMAAMSGVWSSVMSTSAPSLCARPIDPDDGAGRGEQGAKGGLIAFDHRGLGRVRRCR